MKIQNASRITLGLALLAGLGWTSANAAHNSRPQERAASQEQAEQKPAAMQVKIDNFNYEPREISVATGTTVVWTNRDDVPHTVTETNDKFNSKAMDTDDQFSFTFKDPGTYEYYCALHPKMTGKVIVK